jgi:hypothetical protein
MPKPKTTDEALIFWESHPPIMDAFPVSYPTGAHLQEFHGECLKCESQIPIIDFRGTVTQPIPTVVTVEAIGLCRECMLLTPFLARIRDDFTLEYIENTSRQWVSVRPAPPTLWQKTVRLLQRTLQG